MNFLYSLLTCNYPSKMHNLFVFFLPFLFCNPYAELEQEITGGWSPIVNQEITGGWSPIDNVNEPLVVNLGKFAVDENNKNDGGSLKFKNVVNGQSQNVAGINYNLTITATDGSVENKYEAFILDKPWMEVRELVSFKGPV
ncbi:hypothetical protein L2E82_30881 [Cichorium intybus]|uniref:Uncharacterized protein n=1 Tax=Cichorium intybus TaxID=13427 RepID=A0ACB9D1H9_CICIN|nr:hypothetical protein L2E82_30881 [Cichorium intybus]